jgi:hypothetical protein
MSFPSAAMSLAGLAGMPASIFSKVLLTGRGKIFLCCYSIKATTNDKEDDYEDQLFYRLIFFGMTVQAQYKQQLRGTVMDMVLQKPLAGATVTIASLNYTTVTDEEGVFRFKDMPIGSIHITITYSGFKEANP